MEENELYEKILTDIKILLANNFRLDVDYIEEDNYIIQDLELDSMDCVDLFCAMETHYGLEFNDDKYGDSFHKVCKGTVKDITLWTINALKEEKYDFARNS